MQDTTMLFNLRTQLDSTGVDQLKKSVKELQSVTKDGIHFSGTVQELDKIKQTAKIVEKALEDAFDADLGVVNLQKFNKNLQSTGTNLKQVQNDLYKFGAKGVTAFSDITSNATKANTSLQKTETLLDKMGITMLNTAKWGITSGIFNSMTGAVQETFYYVKDLDRSLNDIMIVTDKSSDSMQKFAKQANVAAQSLGKSTLDYTEASLIYYQQGLGEQDVQSRTETTLKTANVTGQSTAAVSEQLTAVWNGYKVSAAEAELYVDKLAAVAASTASDLEELSTGMSKVASAASVMGVNIDQLDAQMATIISVTRQAPESVGTALKTIYARMGDLAIDPKATDEFGVKLGDVSSQLESVGIKVLDANGNLREMGTVTEEVGEKWKGWTTAQREAVAIAMAGKRQYNNLIALFDNWDMYQKSLNTSLEAQGTLQEQNATYMESAEAHLETLGAAYEGLQASLFDVDTVNNFADVMTTVVNLLTQFVTSIGGGQTVLLGLGSIAFRVFHNQIGNELSKAVLNMQRAKEQAEALKRSLGEKSISTLQQSPLESEKLRLRLYEQMQGFAGKLNQEEIEKYNLLQQETDELIRQEAILNEQNESISKFAIAVKANSAEDDFDFRKASSDEQARVLKDIAESAKLSKDSEAEEIGLLGKLKDKYEEVIKTKEELANVKNSFSVDSELENFEKELNKKKATLKSKTSTQTRSINFNNKIKEANEVNYIVLLSKIEKAKTELDAQVNKKGTHTYKGFKEELEALEKSYLDAQKELNEFEKTLGLKEVVDTTGSKKEVALAEKALQQHIASKNKEKSEALTPIEKKETQQLLKLKNIQEEIISNASLLNEEFQNGLDKLVPNELISKLEKVKEEYEQVIASSQKLSNGDVDITNPAVISATERYGEVLKEVYSEIALVGKTAEISGKEFLNSVDACTISTAKFEDKVRSLPKEVAVRVKISDLVNVVGSLGQIASGISSIGRIKDIISDETLTTSEKTLSILENIGFVLPMIVTSAMQLNKAFGVSAIVETFKEIQAVTGLNIATLALKSKEEKKAIALNAEEALSQAILNELLEDEAKARGMSLAALKASDAAELKSLVIQAESIAMQKAKSVAQGEFVAASKGASEISKLSATASLTQKLAVDAGTTSMKGFTTATLASKAAMLLANPEILAVVAIIGVLVVAVGSLIGVYNETHKSVKECTDAFVDSKSAYDATSSEIENLSTQLETAKTRMKELQDLALNGSLLPDEAKELELLQQSTLELAAQKQLLIDKSALQKEQTVKATLDLIEAQKAQEKFTNEWGETQEWLGPLNGLSALPKGITIGLQAGEALIRKDVTYSGPDGAGSNEAAIEYLKEQRQVIADLMGDPETFSIDNLSAKDLKTYNENYTAALANTEQLTTRYEEVLNQIDAVKDKVGVTVSQDVFDELQAEKETLEKTLGEYNSEGQFVFYNVYGKVNVVTEEAEVIKSKVLAAKEDIRKIIDTLSADGVLDEDQQDILTTLENNYSKLDAIRDRSSKSYLEQLKLIEEMQQNLSNNEIETNLENAFANMQSEEPIVQLPENYDIQAQIDGLIETGVSSNEFDIKPVLASDEFVMALDSFLDADYTLNVNIQSDIENDAETAITEIDKLATAAQDITDGFIITADKVGEIAEAFPGALEQAEYLKDGTVKLNKEIAESAIDSSQEQSKADTEKAISELENQNIVLQSKADQAKKLAELATKLDQSETLSALEKTKLLEEYQKAELDYKIICAQQSETISNNLSTSLIDNANAASEATTETYNGMATAADSAFAQIALKGFSLASSLMGNAKSIKDVFKNIWESIKSGKVTDFTSAVSNLYKGGTKETKAVTAKTNKGSSNVSSATSPDTNLNDEDISANWQKVSDYWNGMSSQYTDTINSNNILIAKLKAKQNQLINLKNIAGTKGSKGGGDADAKTIDYLKTELDLFHDIEAQLKRLSNSYDVLEKAQSGLIGKDLEDNLKSQLDIINKQVAAQKQKLGLQKGYLSSYKELLAAQGVGFGDDGAITNYNDMIALKTAEVNIEIAKYNAMSKTEQEAYEATVETKKQELEIFKNYLKSYETLLNDTIPEAESALKELLDKIFEKELQSFTIKVDLAIDTNEAERRFNEFKSKVIDKNKDSDLSAKANTKLVDFNSFYNNNASGDIQTYTKAINDILEKAKTGAYTGHEAEMEKLLDEYQSKLMDSLEDVEDRINEIKQLYLDMIDEASEKFKEHVDDYNLITDELEHQANLIKLIYGEDAYSLMATYYNAQEDNNNAQLDFYKKQVSFWTTKRDAEAAGSDAWNAYNSKLEDAQKGLNGLIENSLQLIVDKYKNAIDGIMSSIGDSLTGGKGLSYVKEEWDLINKNADAYLDTINATYEIQTLSDKYLSSINELDSLADQEKLNKLMNEQITMLEEKDKLTQYDVDRANLMYNIALKQMSLEDLQNSKTKMKLTRDTQGNYSYNYVADEDKVSKAKAELESLQNDLYNMDLDAYQNNLDELYDIYEEWATKVSELYADQTLTDEQREQKKLLYAEQYGALINGIVTENEVIKNNLTQSSFAMLESLYIDDVAKYQAMTDEQKRILMEDMIPYWTSGVQQMADVFANNEDSFLSVCKNAYAQLASATFDYQTSLQALQDAAGVNFANINASINTTTLKTNDLTASNASLIASYNEQLTKMNEVIASLQGIVDKYASMRESAITAATAVAQYTKATQDAIAAVAGLNAAQSAYYNSTNGGGGSGGGSGGGGGSSVLDSKTYTLKVFDRKKNMKAEEKNIPLSDLVNKISRYGGFDAGFGSMDVISTSGITNKLSTTNGSAITEMMKNKGWWTTGFKTGGLVKDTNNPLAKAMGEDSMIAVAAKERVLSVEQTRAYDSLLTGVLPSLAKIIDLSSAQRASDSLLGSFGATANSVGAGSKIEQTVKIEATFEGATEAREIELALSNLVNVASQHALKKN